MISYPGGNEEPANPAGHTIFSEYQSAGTQKPPPKDLFTGTALCSQILRATPSSEITGIS